MAAKEETTATVARAVEETVARKIIGMFERPEKNDGHFCKIKKFRPFCYNPLYIYMKKFY